MPNESSESNPLRVVGVVVFALGVLGWILALDVLYWTAFGLLGISVFSTRTAKLLSDLWMKFAIAIGTINTKILLTLIFYGILTPIALLQRIFTGSPINPVKESDSNFVNVKKEFTPEDFEKTW